MTFTEREMAAALRGKFYSFVIKDGELCVIETSDAWYMKFLHGTPKQELKTRPAKRRMAHNAHPEDVVAAVLADHGLLSASESGEKHDMTRNQIIGIWTRHGKTKVTPKQQRAIRSRAGRAALRRKYEEQPELSRCIAALEGRE